MIGFPSSRLIRSPRLIAAPTWRIGPHCVGQTSRRSVFRPAASSITTCPMVTCASTFTSREQPGMQQTILYFGNDWSADNRTSSHHIARRLARRHRVYYVECPGLRAPKRSGRDARKVWSKLWRFLRGVRPTPQGVMVRTLLQIPLHRFAVMRWFNRLLITVTLRHMMWRENIRQPITWFMVPHLSNVVGRLGERLSVYYCIDDYATLPDVDHDAVRAMDEELTSKADLVFVSAESLLERKRPLNEQTYFSPHGVDFDLFPAPKTTERSCPPTRSGSVGLLSVSSV